MSLRKARRAMRVRVENRLTLVTLGALAGCIATAFAAARVVGGIGLVDAVVTKPFSIAAGIVSGALLGFLVWTTLDPRHRINRLAIILVTINAAAWLLYLVVTPRLENSEDPIMRQRAEYDAQLALGTGTVWTSHPPSLLAGRLLTWVSLPEKPLGLTAGPAVAFAQEQTVPERYWQTGPTVPESYWIALMAFIVSTSWWVTIASLWSALRSRRSFSGD
jgi:hypothetical protein